MKTFIKVCQSVRKMYPKVVAHHAKRDIRSLVYYWLPGHQLSLNWSAGRAAERVLRKAYGMS